MVFVLKGGKYLLRYLYRKQLSEKYEIYRRTKKSARGEGTNSARLFTSGETKALAKSKIRQ